MIYVRSINKGNKMETKIGLSWMKTAIKNEYCVIFNPIHGGQFWDRKFWRDFLWSA